MSRQRTIAISVLSFVCLLHVLAVMGYLVRDGRLSIVPIYDDVIYLIDGLNRLPVLNRFGISGFLANFYGNPPHAPFTAVASTFGLLFSGGAVWGPYLLNGVWVPIAAGLALLALRHLDLRSKVGIVIAMLAAPMFGMVVSEFRPDPVWGLLVGFSLALLAATDILHARPSRLFALGLLFGAAVIAKPTAFPASIVVLSVGYTVQVGLTLILQKDWTVKSVLRRSAVVALGALLLFVPYAIANGVAILAYIHAVMGAGGSVWRTEATVLGHMKYYLSHGAGTLMLGWIWYAGAPVLVLCGALLVYAKDKRALCSFAGLVAAVVASYAIVTVSEVKSLLIGSILYGSIIAAVIWSLGEIVMHTSVRRSIVAILGVLIFATQWVPRAGMIHRADPSMVATDEATRAVFPAVLQALRASNTKIAFVTVPGPVYSATLDFLARQQGVVRTFVEGSTWTTWELFTQNVAGSDVIVLNEAGVRGQAQGFSFPGVQFQPRLLAALRADAAFSGTTVYTDDQGKSVWLFVRK